MKQEIRFDTGCKLIDILTGGAKNVYGFPTGKFINIVGDKSSGKAQPLYSKVLTPSGWRTMGDVHVGDRVINADGTSSVVIGEYPQGRIPTYRMTFTDGSVVDSADWHLWEVRTANQKVKKGVFGCGKSHTIVTTKEIFDIADKNGKLSSGSKRLFVPQTPCVIFDEQTPCIIPPYTLGALLGDGGMTTNTITFTNSEDDVINRVREELESIGYQLNKLKSDDYGYSISRKESTEKPFYRLLDELGLLYCDSKTKFIPKNYLLGNKETRVELLHGMYDTDGCSYKHYYEFDTTSENLSNDFMFLVRSLGGICSSSVRSKPYYIKDGKRVYSENIMYRHYLRFTNGINVFSSKKHGKKPCNIHAWDCSKSIDKIEYIGEVECKCIYINHPRHLYVTDGFTLTHNTFLSNEIIASAYYKYGPKKFKWVYDDCESGYSFDTESLYGFNIMSENPIHSETVEDAFCNISNFAKSLKDGQFGIYVIDSLDGLTSSEQDERAEERIKAFDAGKSYDKGSYGMGKQKYLSQEFFPQLCSKIQDKNILVIIISQIRENVDMFSFEKFSRSGGKGLDFYAYMILWLATCKKIVKKDRPVGVVAKIKMTKGKVPRPFRECMFSFLYDYGLDDVGSCIDYLFDLRTPTGELNSSAKSILWNSENPELNELKNLLEENEIYDTYKSSKYYDVEDTVESITDFINSKKAYREMFQAKFGNTMTRDQLIEYIEANNLQEELHTRVVEKWEKIESSLNSNRKKKYGNIPESVES